MTAPAYGFRGHPAVRPGISKTGHQFRRNARPAVRSTRRGTIRARGTMALYCAPGTETGRPAATASRPARATRPASSHAKAGAEPARSCPSSWNSVRVRPGHSAVTWTPRPDTSVCRLSLNEVTNALVAPYVAPPGETRKPATEETLSTPP